MAGRGGVRSAVSLPPLLLAGLLSILVQTVLLRELMAASQGTEVTIGFGLAAWLMGGAVGSALAARLLRRTAGSRGLLLCFAAAAILVLPGLAFLRGFKPLAGYLPGQGLSLGHMAMLSVAAMSTAGLVFGGMFVFGVRFLTERGRILPAGTAYWAESAGYLAGGAAFTFCFSFMLGGVEAMAAAAAVSLLGIGMTARSVAARRLWSFASAACLAAALFWAPAAEIYTQSLAYPGYRIEASTSSPYGQTVTAERQGQRDIFHNGQPAFHSPPRPGLQQEELAGWGLMHTSGTDDILIIGGADLLPLLTREGRNRVVYAEPDPALIRAIGLACPGDLGAILGRSGLEVAGTDGRAYLAKTKRRFDLIILSLPPPTSVTLNRYYTREFFSEAGVRLKDGGALVLALPGSQAALEGALARMNRAVFSALSAAMPRVDAMPGEVWYLVGTKERIGIADSVLLLRHRERLSGLGSFTETYVAHKLEGIRRRDIDGELSAAGSAMNSDLKPEAISAGIALWQRMYSPGWARAYQIVVGLSRWLWLPLVLGLLWPRLRHRGAAFTSGAASMGIQALCLWGVQVKSGALYHWLGAGNALFMGGTAMGAWACTRLRPVGKGHIARLELAFSAWALAFMLGLAFLEMPGWAFLACSAVTGAMLGLEFPALAQGMSSELGIKEASAAGPVYAWDMAGGSFAALAAGVVIIPAWGMVPAAALMSGLKLLSLRWWIKG